MFTHWELLTVLVILTLMWALTRGMRPRREREEPGLSPGSLVDQGQPLQRVETMERLVAAMREIGASPESVRIAEVACESIKGDNILDAASPPWESGRRPFSLWSVMEYFKVGMYLRVAALAAELDAKRSLLADLGAGDAAAVAAFKKPLPVDERGGLCESIKLLVRECDEAKLASAADGARRLLAKLEEAEAPSAEIYRCFGEFRRRLEDDASRCKLISLSPKAALLLESPQDGWKEVAERFADSIVDVEEMQKCLALERYAAAVFHSVQVVEVGLIALGQFIEVNDPLSGWSAVSKKLGQIIEKKYTDRTQKERQASAFLEQVQGTVEALKNAWRNKISHAQSRLVLMRTDFTPEIAEEIVMATRAFMRRLATELPQ